MNVRDKRTCTILPGSLKVRFRTPVSDRKLRKCQVFCPVADQIVCNLVKSTCSGPTNDPAYTRIGAD
jgi:hypothetical protein